MRDEELYSVDEFGVEVGAGFMPARNGGFGVEATEWLA